MGIAECQRRLIERVRCEKSFFEKCKALNYASFFGRKAKAFWCDLDLSFGDEGYASQQEIKLAGGR
jgi:hypothetical protein